MPSLKKHFGTVQKKGEHYWVKFDDPVAFNQALLNLCDKEVYVTVGKKTKRRSVNQNAYFHAIVLDYIAPAMGETPEACKEILKYELLRTQTESGKFYIKNTSELTTVEFEEFCFHCRRLASEFYGLYVPLPNEIEY